MLRGLIYSIAFFLFLSALAYADLILRWQDNSAVEDGYEVYRQERPQQRSFQRVAVLSPSTTRWVDTNTRRNRTYCYFVVAFKVGSDQGGSSNVKCAKDDGRNAASLNLQWNGSGRNTELVVDQQLHGANGR
jgi:hypothetical protein